MVYYDQNGRKTILFGAAHNYIAHKNSVFLHSRKQTFLSAAADMAFRDYDLDFFVVCKLL